MITKSDRELGRCHLNAAHNWNLDAVKWLCRNHASTIAAHSRSRAHMNADFTNCRGAARQKAIGKPSAEHHCHRPAIQRTKLTPCADTGSDRMICKCCRTLVGAPVSLGSRRIRWNRVGSSAKCWPHIGSGGGGGSGGDRVERGRRSMRALRLGRHTRNRTDR